MPLPINKGVFGITRITEIPGFNFDSIKFVVFPAAKETTNDFAGRVVPRSVSRSPRSCGLTTNITTSHSAAISGVAALRAPYLMDISSARSSRFSEKLIRSGAIPAVIQPAKRASPIIPTPKKPIVKSGTDFCADDMPKSYPITIAKTVAWLGKCANYAENP